MRQPKALLPWEGEPLIAYQVEALHAVAHEVIVVLGHRHEELESHVPRHASVRVVVNPDYALGRSTSVKAGAAAVGPDADAVLILSVDQPRPPDVLRALVDAHDRHRPLITIPEYQGKHGHPPVFSARLVPELRQVKEETLGLKEVVDRHRADIYYVDLGSPTVLLDLNRPQDYEAARRAWKGAR